MPARRIARLAAAAGIWAWIAGGVAWGLLCVGVRHAALRAGMEMEDLVARRQAALDRLQGLEREAGTARRLERVEARAVSAGFVTPSSRQLVIAPAEPAGPAWASWWPASTAASASAPGEEFKIRPREDVVLSADAGGRTAADRDKGKSAKNKNKKKKSRRTRAPRRAAAP